MFSHEDIWNHVITELTRDTSPTVLRSWFDDMKILQMTRNKTVLYTQPKFKREIVQQRYMSQIKSILSDLMGVPMSIEIIIEEELDDFNRREPPPEDTVDYKAFTFEGFVVGSANKFAHAAAQAVADNPAGAYNPLFLYGQSGLGKTHLLYAMMSRITAAFPHFKVQYVTGENFTQQLVTAIRLGKNYEFHDTYRQLDVLLVDDIQFIAGKEFAQEEFFNTFNALWEAGHQIILSSDRPPKDMLRLEDRLRSRFEWGLIADLQPPDFETRLAIVNVKAFRLGLMLSRDVSEFIATAITANVRQLEGVVKKLLAYRDLMKGTVDLEAAKTAVEDIVRESPGLAPTPQLILQEICSYYNLDQNQVLGGNRRSDLVNARQITMYLCRTLTDKSLHEIGKFMKRDHTTVGHGCDRVDMQKNADPRFAKELQTLYENIRNK